MQETQITVPEGGFDAVICLGNSFAHLPDFQGDLSNQKLAIENFKDMLKPGGVLFLDHRNYDAILDTGKAPSKNLYYNVSLYNYLNVLAGINMAISVQEGKGRPQSQVWV